MYKDNLFAIDLSKHSFQGCLLDKYHHERFNRRFTRTKLTDWLSRQQPLTVAMEACGSAHHWARLVERMSRWRYGYSSSSRGGITRNWRPGLKPLSAPGIKSLPSMKSVSS